MRTLLASFLFALSAVSLHPAQSPPSAADSNTTTIVHVTIVDVATDLE